MKTIIKRLFKKIEKSTKRDESQKMAVALLGLCQVYVEERKRSMVKRFIASRGVSRNAYDHYMKDADAFLKEAEALVEFYNTGLTIELVRVR